MQHCETKGGSYHDSVLFNLGKLNIKSDQTWFDDLTSYGNQRGDENEETFRIFGLEVCYLGIFKEEFAPELDDYQESEYSFVYPTSPLIESIVLDIPVGPNYKYLNNTIKDSSYFPRS